MALPFSFEDPVFRCGAGAQGVSDDGSCGSGASDVLLLGSLAGELVPRLERDANRLSIPDRRGRIQTKRRLGMAPWRWARPPREFREGGGAVLAPDGALTLLRAGLGVASLGAVMIIGLRFR